MGDFDVNLYNKNVFVGMFCGNCGIFAQNNNRFDQTFTLIPIFCPFFVPIVFLEILVVKIIAMEVCYKILYFGVQNVNPGNIISFPKGTYCTKYESTLI